MKRISGLAAIAIACIFCITLSTRISARSSIQDVFIFSPTELEPGGVAALRVVVMETSGLDDSAPLSGALVEIVLEGKDRSKTLVRSLTDRRGTIDDSARVPEFAPGDGYELVVKVSSRLGKYEKRKQVTLAPRYRILLSLDKPLYQPGQRIHIRAVALKLSDLAPVPATDVTLEVEDPRGNKVFKKIGTTDRYGIFSGDFQLADEIRLGDYRVRAVVGDREAEKLVTVKRYVLPKFKVALDTDKTHYKPGDKLKGTVSANYFFGKAVEGGSARVKVQAFDVEFHTVAEVQGKTDANGNFDFEIDLPDSFVGQPLEQGDAFIRLDAEVIDLARHTEKASARRKVAASDLRLELVPEAGRIIPGVENKIFAVVTTPDDRPVASAGVQLEIGTRSTISARTDDTGIAEFSFTPARDSFSMGGEGKYVLGVRARAEDRQGREVEVLCELFADSLKDNLLLRLDRAIYRSGDDMKVEVLSTFKSGSVYLDLIRNRRAVVTRALEFDDGRAGDRLALGPDLFGTLEVHAYVIMPSGEIMRDTRVVYVEPADDLEIKVSLAKDTYRPGEEATLRFTVTDKQGRGKASALGVSIVDESVFAIQEMRPGLLKVYFTLEKELAKPRYEVHFSPGGESVESLIRDDDEIEARRDRIMKVLLAGVDDPTTPEWSENPARGRMKEENQNIQQYANYLLSYVSMNPFLDRRGGEWNYRPDLTAAMVEKKIMDKSHAHDSFGNPYRPEILTGLDPSLELRAVSDGIASYRLLMIYQALHGYYNQEGKSWMDKLFEGGELDRLPEDTLEKLVEKKYLDQAYVTDPWGKSYVIRRRDREKDNPYNAIFKNYDVFSAGADGESDTKDDISDPYLYSRMAYLDRLGWGIWVGDEDGLIDRLFANNIFANSIKGGGPMKMMAKDEDMHANAPELESSGSGRESKNGGKPIRVREYFPETLWWEPALFTDGRGRAELTLPLADSITTWRMTALGHSADGLLGSMTGGIRVFQDFFVDIDFPVALTQGDEVEVPVAIYNYLPGPQTVTLEIREHPGFELLSPPRQTARLSGGQVDVRYFRVKADKVGKHSLTVYATGSKLSDAIKRSVEVVPDGLRLEVVKNGRVTGPLTETVEIPEAAIDDASRIMVKVYPGVFAQVLEGMDGIFRMPSGCFEQTTSATYPNVMVLAYMKKTKTISPEIQMKAEGFINLGYQRLLSFEVPGGGFEWFGNDPAHKVLTAYGLMEFHDMSKVYDIDESVIARTQQWLADRQEADGSWKPVEHWLETLSGEDFSKSVELNTAYITWALADTGYRGEATAKGIRYLKNNMDKIEDAYTLALVVNALVSADPKDKDARELLRRLAKLGIEDKKTGTVHWEPKGKTAVHGGGQSARIETTSLILYAMIKARTDQALVNKGLAWISQQKDAFGTFQSTQATILAFKVLLAAEEGTGAEVSGDILVSLGDREEKLAITPQTSDVMRLVDFKDQTATGLNRVEIKAPEDMGLMYQVLGIYYLPWDKVLAPEDLPLLTLDLAYDRESLKTDDILTATVTAEYKGGKATDMVILDLGIPPGFKLLTDAFEELKQKNAIEKFTATGRQITVYVRRMEKNKPLKFSYQLKAKFPVKAQTPKSTAYEYYDPAVRAESRPVEIEVTR